MRMYLRLKSHKRSKSYQFTRYGLTKEKFNQLLAKQNGVCAICEQPEKHKKRLSVDHCHETKRVRGLLCSNCNVGLGFFRDNPKVLRASADYLENWG
jgi:hypothetical protein